MPATAADDVGFTFDPKPFLAGLQKANGGLEKLEKTTKAVGEKMSSAMTWGMLKAQALGAAIKGAVSNVANQIPEIGQTFKIANDIFMKNFLWPLRQALGPYLQHLLDWVRDNRAQFAKWGQVLANAFRTGVILAQQLWNILSGLWTNILKPIIGSIFGSEGIGGGVNLLLAKLAIVASFLTATFNSIFKSPIFKAILADLQAIVKNVVDFVAGLFKANRLGDSMATFFKPLAQAIGLAFKVIGDVVKALTDGIMKSSLTQIMTPLTNVAEAIAGLMKNISDFTGSEGGQSFFSWIGQNFGNDVMLTITSITTGIMLLVDALQWLMYVIRGVTALSTGQAFDWAKEASSLASQQAELLKKQGASYAATFQNIGSSMGIGPTINMGGLTVTVTQAESMIHMSDAEVQTRAKKTKESVEQVINEIWANQTNTGRTPIPKVR